MPIPDPRDFERMERTVWMLTLSFIALILLVYDVMLLTGRL